MEKMQDLRNNKGITLVSLVVTIIVILILAGIAISLAVGNNGVIGQASNAAIKNKEGTAREQIAMAWASCEADYLAAWASNANVNKASYFEVGDMNGYCSLGTITAKSGQTYSGANGAITNAHYANNKGGTADFEADFATDANGNITTFTITKK